MDLKESKILVEELMKMNKNLENQNIALEMEVKASKKIIKNLKRKTELLDEYEEAVIDRDDSIKKFEKGKSIADNVIKNLKKELNLKEKEIFTLQNIAKEKESLDSENQNLERDILDLQRVDKKKEEDLEAMNIEKNVLEDRLIKLKEYKVIVDEKSIQTDFFINKIQENFATGTGTCDECECKFENISELEMHTKKKHGASKKQFLEMKLKNVECKLVSEKFELSLKLSLLKEKEIEETNSCHCKNFCRIYHPKHNWKKSLSNQILGKMMDIAQNVNCSL